MVSHGTGRRRLEEKVVGGVGEREAGGDGGRTGRHDGHSGPGIVAGTDGGGLAMEFDIGASAFALDTFDWMIAFRKTDKAGEKNGNTPQGLLPSQGREDWTHWSQACLEVVARDAEAEPFRLPWTGAGFSFAWHLLTCLERRSLETKSVNRWSGGLGAWSGPSRELVAAELTLVGPVAGVCGE
jgi:hypothetical protein